MTNAQIIFNEAIAHEVYTPEQIEMYLEKLGSIPLHTFKKWNDLGYKVKKGEHARVVTYLWKPNVVKEDGEEKETTDLKMYMRKSHLFTIEQVEKIA
jgi:antirestriction protein ArdC